MPRAALLLAALACLMGAAGVALAALATHRAGGDLGRTAAEFLILHAAALVGASAHLRATKSRGLMISACGLALGTLLFAGDLSMRAFADARLFPFAAPTGGSLMILSWIAMAAGFGLAASSSRAK